MSDLLDWVEKSAIENLKTHHACADVIAKDAATTLTVFLAALGGGLAYGAKALDQNSFNWLSIGTIAFTGWFLVLSLLLVWKCLMFREMPNIYNEPRNIYQPSFSLEDLKEAEVIGLQRRIDVAAKSNVSVVKWLNGLRLAAAASPLVFIAAAFVAWRVAA
ncbi:hypothetical protein UXJ30_13985 [Burkholderia cenocepacia]|jgi:hypothetical protein|uniref:Hypothetical phage protein n=1 Tax=Burkholderia cenocepacia (strain ATCC BAA-245 / DSM 16553 / LMG 16656 / NCTC 13227 / J2315 / CF5610) TaxID=216591 RepID=B4EG61_BURCJ|nr:hypothetical protein [Burkholderia cenocepacia]KIS50245.1 hypothetical protein NP88_2232 [Burkholderia cepacia]MCO2667108.1 hypothetical protein [Pseudomonas aeruginosa]EPZ88538.1 hypothetical protein BURCENK562V_C3110 [Burkholderia cenocepacia K56-2Valvano]KKI81581.1 hypothetical protein WQ49_16095 [Burkholderia cenocepacia]ONR50507.1 hypothetical protein A8E17_33515 [Burkholderia cenocepacia]